MKLYLTLRWPGVTKHIIALALGWCLLSILLGLFYAFDAMEASNASLAIAAFFKVTGLTLLIGIIVICLPLLIWKSINEKSHTKELS